MQSGPMAHLEGALAKAMARRPPGPGPFLPYLISVTPPASRTTRGASALRLVAASVVHGAPPRRSVAQTGATPDPHHSRHLRAQSGRYGRPPRNRAGTAAGLPTRDLDRRKSRSGIRTQTPRRTWRRPFTSGCHSPDTVGQAFRNKPRFVRWRQRSAAALLR
jgi:hypothetical protein